MHYYVNSEVKLYLSTHSPVSNAGKKQRIILGKFEKYYFLQEITKL